MHLGQLFHQVYSPLKALLEVGNAFQIVRPVGVTMLEVSVIQLAHAIER